MQKYTIIIQIVFLLLFGKTLFAQNTFKLNKKNIEGITTLSSKFERIYMEDNAYPDSVSGTFYYKSPDEIFLDITFPLHQIMVIRDNTTTIYYPESKQAFKLTSVNPMVLPLISGLLTTLRPDYGMGDFGFELFDQKAEGDTLISYWSHPKIRDKMGDYEIAEVDGKLLYSYYQAPDKESMSRILFSDYTDKSRISFPLSIHSEMQMGPKTMLEFVTLGELIINQKLPEFVDNFYIPEDIEVVEREW